MNIAAIDTWRSLTWPHLIWVELTTDDGVVGLGETYYWPEATSAYIHECMAPLLVGLEVPSVEDFNARYVRSRLGSKAFSVETRAHSAVDMALWDLAGQRAGSAVFELLGGAARDCVRIYNSGDEAFTAPDAERLAQELLDAGISALKLYPFHPYVAEHAGADISVASLEAGRAPLEAIRAAFGDRLDVALELGCRWGADAAAKIVAAVDDLGLMWIEDPVVPDAATFERVRKATNTPWAISEYLATAPAFREFFERGLVGLTMLDPGWVGGLTECCKVAATARAHGVPVTTHDFTGPLVYCAGVHLGVADPNVVIAESARSFYDGWYREVLTALPEIQHGRARPPAGPGWGTSLLPEFKGRPDVRRATTDTPDEARRMVALDALGYTYEGVNAPAAIGDDRAGATR